MAIRPKMQINTKRLQIDKANATMVGVVAAAAFIAVFSLVSSRALWNQRSYQARVIEKKEQARDQLNQNVEEVEKLVIAYQDFTGSPSNVLEGNPAGTGEKDGDNARVVLDALPSVYDYPALITSLEKILNDKKFKIDGIVGVDQEVEQAQNNEDPDPEPVEMPFEITVTGSYSSVQDLVGTFERSIRPFHMQKITFSGNNDSLQFKAAAKTYYQPAKSLKEKLEDVK